jgi:hypothetical protein
MRQPNAYGESNSHIHANCDANGNGAVANGDSYCDGNCHIHSDGDCDGDGHIHANCDGDSDVYANCDGDSNGDCDRIAAAYTDATASADTAAPTVRPAGCLLARELASEPREFPLWPPSICFTRHGSQNTSRDSLVPIGRRCVLGDAPQCNV